MCHNVWNRIFAENAPKILKKIRQNMNVRMLSNKTSSKNCVQLPWLIGIVSTFYQGGGACSIPGKYNIFKLRLPPSQDEN